MPPAPDFSPDSWSQAERIAAEDAEVMFWPPHARLVTGSTGLVTTTASPLSVLAGVEVLRHRGSAADAAVAAALTQIVTALGSYVSCAGTLQLLHYDAAARTTDSLEAGWNTWLAEADPASIPSCDLSPLPFGRKATQGAEGRKTLVPGFMAGLEAMHQRFGRLPFASLFQPAIAYAERGITLSPTLVSYFSSRGKYLDRTPGGRAFVRQCGRDSPAAGDRFVQTDLANTLRAVAEQGAAYMYTSDWGREYVTAIQREGGCASMNDLARYRPSWEAPLRTTFHNTTILVPGASAHNASRMLEALHLAQALRLDNASPYFRDPNSFRTLASIVRVTALDAGSSTAWLDWKRRRALSLDPAARITPVYAHALAAAFGDLAPPDDGAPPPSPPTHSAAVIAIDAEGNIAALVHTINTLPWGSTGIVVGGIPISDAAAFQQARLATLAPGARVPSGMVPLIAFRDDRPILALAAIGASLVPETLRLAIGVLANRLDLASLCAAPVVLESWEPPQPGDSFKQGTVGVPDGAYSREFLDQLAATGVRFALKSRQEVARTRGTAVAAIVDPETSTSTSAETPGVCNFAATL